MDREVVDRKLAQILSADPIGYSRLMADDEEGTVRSLKAHNEIIDRLLATDLGRMCGTAGDSLRCHDLRGRAMQRASLAVVLAALVVALTPAVSSGQQFGTGYVMEMRKLLGNPFPRLVYVCSSECTPEQFAAIPVPTGWEKSIPKEMLPIAEGSPYPPPPGEPSTVDYIPEIPGAEFALVAELLGGALLSVSPLIVVAQVGRSTVFTYEAGRVVHELTDPDGSRYILFVVAIELIEGGLDPSQLDAFDSLVLPEGWTYSSRTLAGDLVVDSESVATVFSHSELTTWQLYNRTSSIPLLSPAVTYGLAFLITGVGWALMRRRERRTSFSNPGEQM